MTIDEQIENIDRSIKEHEAALAYLNEKRRELVNRGNLNKCAHEYMEFFDEHDVPVLQCMLCGKERPL